MRLSKWEKTTWPQIPVFPISIIVFCFPQCSNYKKHSLLILLIYNGGERYRNCARLPARLHRQSAFIFPGRFWTHGQKKTVSVLNSHCIVQTIFTLKYTEAKIKKVETDNFSSPPPSVFPSGVHVGAAVPNTIWSLSIFLRVASTNSAVRSASLFIHVVSIGDWGDRSGARLPAWLHCQSAFIFQRDFVPGKRQSCIVRERFIQNQMVAKLFLPSHTNTTNTGHTAFVQKCQWKKVNLL